MEKLNVLVVDDKRVIGDLFDFILGYAGHHIHVVQSGNDAIEAVQKGQYDIVFLDIVMPEKDGVETLEKIKTINPALPVVMMSGYSVEEKRQKVKELGAITTLKKPFEMDDVRKVVKVALGKDI